MALRTEPSKSLWKEIIHESVAGVTDCLFTCLCVSTSFWLFNRVEPFQEYFHSVKHVYWLFYFVHIAIVDQFVWAGTYRNSALYIYARGHSQSRSRTAIIILCQYISIFLGAWISCKMVENIPIFDEELQSQLVFNFVGHYEHSLDWKMDDYSLFIGQTIVFQVFDRLIAGFTVTVSPLLKKRTVILDGSWMVVSWRCLLAHYLITNGRYSLIVNPNYTFYDCLYHWRWSQRDILVLILPYICVLFWNRTFNHLPFLFNPSYFETDNKLQSKGELMTTVKPPDAKETVTLKETNSEKKENEDINNVETKKMV